ncbi:hypothetical protein Lser_V15G07089 [Lactuca serriola]
MAGGTPNMDQFELYFKRADSDHDGRISGVEAVSFFQASGLPTRILAQIWTHADQNRTGYLGRPEFYNALKLVTVAQSKRELTSDIVKAALYGPASAKIPPPQINLAALPAPQSSSNPGPPALQIPASVPPASHRVPQGYPSHQNQNMRPHPHVTQLTNMSHGQPREDMVASRPNGPIFSTEVKDSSPVAGNGFATSSTFGDNSSASSQGNHNVAQQPNVVHNHNQHLQPNNQRIPVRSGNLPSTQPWPKMTQSNVQKYTKIFVKVDTDRDGKITGEQARTLFLGWELPRDILKQVWDLSDQDNDSMLSLNEFCIALFLMERHREGHSLPKTLPSGILFEGTPITPLPLATQVWRHAPGVNQQQVTHAATKPPRPVPVPIDKDLQPKHQKPKVPVLEKHLVDQLSNEEQSSLNSKFQEATEADKKVGELEKEILEARQKTEFYRNKMQEIVLYKSRCDNRLNEITERVISDRKEVESLSKKYEDKYKQAGDVASKLTIEEATFRDIQEKKMEIYRAIVKLDQGGKPDDIQVLVDRIQSDLEEQIKTLNERCKMYGLRGKPSLLLELPFGWQGGIQEGAADWDENWDNFDDEGFTFVKDLTLDVQNVLAPPKQKSLPVQNKPAFQNESSSSTTGVKDKKSDNESIDQDKGKIVKSPPDSPGSIKIFQDFPPEDMSPHAVKSESEADKPTFDSNYDSEAGWDFTATNHKDLEEESDGNNMLFDSSSDNWGRGLNPIRTELPKFDSIPSTPAYSYSGSPPGNNLFHNQSPFSAFADSVPSTPAYSNAGSPRRNSISNPVFADSVPSTPMFDDHSFNNFSRFDSFSSTTTRDNGIRIDSFSRFDSFRSTAQDSEVDQGFFPTQKFTRFDSMNSIADSDFGHSLFQPRESFSRFDSMRSTADSSHGFPSFDDADPFGSNNQLKSETPRRDSVDGWKAF